LIFKTFVLVVLRVGDTDWIIAFIRKRTDGSFSPLERATKLFSMMVLLMTTEG
jgi:hypothetical protein